jgi:hypothetical protein
MVAALEVLSTHGPSGLNASSFRLKDFLDSIMNHFGSVASFGAEQDFSRALVV